MSDSEEEISDDFKMNEYQTLLKERHDVLHKFVCKILNIEFGEMPIFYHYPRILKSDFSEYIKNQSPDLVLERGNKIFLIDVTISSSIKAEQYKLSKYDLLKRVLSQIEGREVIIIPIVYDPVSQDLFDSNFLSFDDQIMKEYEIIKEEIEKITKKLIKLSEYFENNDKVGYSLLSNQKITYDFNELKKDIISFKNIPFNDINDLNKITSDDVPMNEDDVINEALQYVDNLDSNLTKNEKADSKEFWSFHTKYSSFKYIVNPELRDILIDQSNKFRSYLPLPNCGNLDVDLLEERSTLQDEELIKVALSYFKESSDMFLRALGDRSKKLSPDRCKAFKFEESECYRFLSLTKEEIYTISLEGPMRKQFQRKSDAHRMASNKYSNIWLNPNLNCDSIKELSFHYSKILNPNDDVLKWRGPGLNYLRFCQQIYREININALRKQINKCFIIKPTLIKDVFVIIFQGPMLRSGELSSLVWFKIAIIGDSDRIIKNGSRDSHWKSWYFHSKCYSSKWLSVDSNRLDHYIRCYDRVIISYLSYINVKDESLSDSIENDTSNTLGMMILIYLEDKRSTSKMLQDVRYMFMSKLSVYDYSSCALERFKVPIRTPLQLYLLKRVVDYFVNYKFSDVVKKITLGKYNSYAGSTKLNDKYGSSLMVIRRILTDGNDINFDQALHEMYFCMLFNKNQDDPTHASFQILSKILAGEANLKKIKETTGLHNGYLNTWQEDMKVLIHTNIRNQFSRSAICVGSLLQQKSTYVGRDGHGVSYLLAASHPKINKTIDEFATFKASSLLDREIFDNKIQPEKSRKKQKREGDFFSDSLTIDKYDLKEDDGYILGAGSSKQNRRRRCAQGVIELLQQKKFTAFDVFMKHKTDSEDFQVFKKNQIGGVREILILHIKDRIMINILETISRIVCSKDTREMLTHGSVKNKKFHEMIRRVRQKSVIGKVFHLNFDKSKWGPSFQPIQFIYLFLPFKEQLGDLFNLIMIILIKHSNKRVIMPERLIRAWVKDSENRFHHNFDENLENLKQKFRKDKELLFINESNMGQGILHFTSSLLHLALVSFRDKLFSEWLKKNDIKESVYWEDILSSDDSYTSINTGTADKKISIDILNSFLKCQEVSERLFNCETSKSKSSISNIVYEFNSLFGSNLGFHPTRIKFALSSLDCFYTDSFFRMVKESYNVCRAFFENGASLELFLISHRMNKEYSEHIYNTKNIEKKLSRSKSPYQIGFYPMGNAVLMLIFGPEFHNYQILCDIEQLSEIEKNIFFNMHTITNEKQDEFDFTSSETDLYVGVNRILTKLRPSHLIKAMRRIIPRTPEEVRTYIQQDPLFILRKPMSENEVELKVSMKLMSNSSEEAARNINPAFFYGRMSASRTAKCFYIPGVHETTKTYSDCIDWLSNERKAISDPGVFFPEKRKFENVLNLIKSVNPSYVNRNLFESKRYMHLKLQEEPFKLDNSLHEILKHMWIKKTEKNSLNRDMVNLMSNYHFIKESMEDTIKQFSGERSEQVKKLCLLLSRLMSDAFKPMKCVNYGENSNNVETTIMGLLSSCMTENSVTSEDLVADIAIEGLSKFEEIKMISNYTLMRMIEDNAEGKPIKKIPKLLNKIEENVIFHFMKNANVPPLHKKILFFVFLCTNRASEILDLAHKTEFILNEYVKEQKMNDQGEYTGHGIIKCQTGDYIMELDNGNGVFKTNVYHPNITFKLINECMRLLNVSLININNKNGNFTLTNKGISESKLQGNILIKFERLTSIKILPGDILFNKGQFLLYNRLNNRPIIRIKNWIIPCRCPRIFKETLGTFRGVQIPFLIKHNVFSYDFHIENIRRTDCVEALTDVVSPEFSITEITYKNLNIELNIEEEEMEEETKIFDSGEDVIDLDLVMEINEFQSNQQFDEPESQVESFQVEDILDIDNVFTVNVKMQKLKKSTEIVQERVWNMNALLITYCMVDLGSICDYTFSQIDKMIETSPRHMDVLRCVLWVYQQQINTIVEGDNEQMNIIINPVLLMKLGVQTRKKVIIRK